MGSKKIPEPIPGQDDEFDEANKRVEKVKQKINSYLSTVRKELKNQTINYTTGSAHYRYEIEVPDELEKNVPSDYVKTSSAKGRKRY